MNNTIQTDYIIRTYEAQRATGAKRQANTTGSSFSYLAAQALAGKTAVNGISAVSGSSVVNGNSAVSGSSAAAQTAGTGIKAENTEGIQAPSLESMLKAKYPGIAYHVFDASTSYWRTRNDYPHYLLYQQDCDTKALENWRPSGENPFYGSIDGQFIAPKEIHALGNVPPGSKAVVIHPDVQKRMEEDPDYAYEIMATIDNWFAYDVARNEAIRPGCTVGMSQAVAIGEDGNICNACSSSPGRITYSKSGSDDEESWWDLRMARHAEFMKLAVEKQIQRHIQADQLAASAAAKSQLAAMLTGGNLREIFGSEIAGIPTETVLAITQSQVWGGGAIL